MNTNEALHSTAGFRVYCCEEGGWTVVECHGRLNSQNAPLLREEVRELIRSRKRILLDLKEVPMMDSSGLGTIVSLLISARTRGCQIQVSNANQCIRDLFSMANVLSLFEHAGRYHGKTI